MTDGRRNNSVDCFRYLCALLVVAIHTTPFLEFSPTFSFFVSQIISRIAVPFFFLISGYYFEIERAGRILRKHIVTYTIWSIPFFVYTFLVDFRHGGIVYAFKDCAVGFLLFGSTEPYWFFPALIISLLLILVLSRKAPHWVIWIVSLILYIVGVLGGAYYHAVGINVPVLSVLYEWKLYTPFRRIVLMGFPFTLLGYSLRRWCRSFTWAGKPSLVIVMAVLFFVEAAFIHHFHLGRDNITTLALYPLMISIMAFLIEKPMADQTTLGKVFRTLASITYLFHPVLLLAVKIASLELSTTAQFVSAVIISGGAAVLASKVGRLINGKTS